MVKRPLPFRPVPKPASISVLLQEAGNFDTHVTDDSIACNSCYLFCKRLLQQCDEDLHPPESIVYALKAKVADIQDRLHQCMDSNDTALLHAANYLGHQMVSDQAVTFPMVYQKYLQGRPTSDVPPLPRYKVLVFLGKEFWDLHVMSSVSPRNRVGRLLFRTKCDPFVMLSHALGTAKKNAKNRRVLWFPK